MHRERPQLNKLVNVEQADPGRTALTVRTNELIHSRSSFSDYVGTECQKHSILAVARRRFIKARRRMVVEKIHIYIHL